MRSQEKHRLILCSAEELREGERRLFEVDGVEIGLIRAEGTCYAFRNSCPHQGVPMLYGSVVGTMLPSEPQEYVYGLHNEIIRCPLHGWEFNLKTGKALFSSGFHQDVRRKRRGQRDRTVSGPRATADRSKAVRLCVVRDDLKTVLDVRK